MDRRLPARVLALLALVGVSVALYAVVSSGTQSPGTDASSTATSTTEKGTPASDAKAKTTKRSGRRRYTVKSGDTPSGIAEKTDVPVDRLLELNPDLDAQALQTGQRLKLR